MTTPRAQLVLCAARPPDSSWIYRFDISSVMLSKHSPTLSGRGHHAGADSGRPAGPSPPPTRATTDRRTPMSRRSALLELAVLGLLHDTPMHGYELRKRLNAVLGAFRALSYGTLYPCLRRPARPRLDHRGGGDDGLERAARPHQPAGPDRLRAHRRGQGALPVADLRSPARRPGRTARSTSTSPSSPAPRPRCGCGSSRAAAAGWRSGSTRVRTAAARGRERLDRYTAELQRHGLESVEREVRWLTELIETERRPRRPPHLLPARRQPRRHPLTRLTLTRPQPRPAGT